MQKITMETIEEQLSDLDLDTKILFAHLPAGNKMYIMKLFGAGDGKLFRFQNLGNIRTKLTDGEGTVEGSVKQAIDKGATVWLLDGAWQLAMLITRHTADQEDISDEKKEG